MDDHGSDSILINPVQSLSSGAISGKADLPARTAMSLESILDAETLAPKRCLYEDSERQAKIRRSCRGPGMTTVTCLYGVVAQKSYGSEKRFLCPPPSVSICASDGEPAEASMVSVGVVTCESVEHTNGMSEQRAVLDEQHHANFKYLHVGSTAAKARHVCLRLSLGHVSHHAQSSSLTLSSPLSSLTPFATFLSGPIAVISKPSKKTVKSRNVSSCVDIGSPVSLFNRINSQTVRTKYLASSNDRLCAKGSGWSAFEIVLVHSTPSSPSNTPLTYGTRIILRDAHTGTTSPYVIVRKVDKGRIQPCLTGIVSQMQKIALQLASSVDKSGQDDSLPSPGSYLNAGASVASISTPDVPSELAFTPSRLVKSGVEEVDDCLCWTIVNIAKLEYVIPKDRPHPSPPPSPPRMLIPLPLLSSIEYISDRHIIAVTGEHLLHLRFWLGPHGPLLPHEPHPTRIEMRLPDTDELLLSNHDLVTTLPNARRHLELPLSLVRQDGVVCSLGKSLACDMSEDPSLAQWTIVSATTA